MLLSLLVPALLVTASPAAAETCPNEAFRTGASANLPDCRAYEQVTPVHKEGGRFSGSLGVGPEGEPDVLLESTTAIDGTQFDAGIAQYSTTRTASGWATSPMTLPATEYQVALPAGYILVGALDTSLDARSGLWVARGDSQPENRVDLYVTRPGGAIEDVGPVTPPGTPVDSATRMTQQMRFEVAGFSDDLSHILFSLHPAFSSGYDFWPFDETKKEERSTSTSLYEFIGAGNTVPQLVGVDDNGSLISTCGTEVGGEFANHNAMSGDGSTIFFTAEKCGASPPVNELFARVDNGQSDAHTVAISEPSVADCSACDTSAGVLQPGHFESASVDGSKVFFSTSQPLLGGDTSKNIYEYDFDAPEGQRIVRVSGGDSTVTNPTAEVEGLVQSSEDGSHVYFVAQGLLTRAPNGQGQVAHAGANNLYVFERDAEYPAGRTAFIADLSEADMKLWWRAGFQAARPADVTPDGRFMVFTSVTPRLTPDDTGASRQVFEYDAQTGALVRVSIGQDGFNDNGNTDLVVSGEEEELIRYVYTYGSGEGSRSNPRDYWEGLTMSTDGSYVFFQSTVGLTPQAFDHKVVGERQGHLTYANNIYEYHDGNVYLISDGRDVSQSHGGNSSVALAGVGASGADVFFETGDSLVPQDADSDVDLYDARIDGGFPAPVVTPECSGDGCQGPLSAAPVLLSPGSEFQAGVESATPVAESLSPAKAKAKKAKPKRKGKRKVSKKRRGRAAGRGPGHGKAGRT